jgi:hypothetical protein
MAGQIANHLAIGSGMFDGLTDLRSAEIGRSIMKHLVWIALVALTVSSAAVPAFAKGGHQVHTAKGAHKVPTAKAGHNGSFGVNGPYSGLKWVGDVGH